MELLALEQKVLAFCRENDLLPQGCRVTVALSGGPDSMALLTALLHLRPVLGLHVSAAHFHHHLRGAEADRDRAFVKDRCEALAVPLSLGEGDAPARARACGESEEEAARALRYGFLDRLDCDRVATAHNAEDNTETVLLHLIRGTGPRGLAGIPVRRGRYRRGAEQAPPCEPARFAGDGVHDVPSDGNNLPCHPARFVGDGVLDVPPDGNNLPCHPARFAGDGVLDVPPDGNNLPCDSTRFVGDGVLDVPSDGNNPPCDSTRFVGDGVLDVPPEMKNPPCHPARFVGDGVLDVPPDRNNLPCHPARFAGDGVLDVPSDGNNPPCEPAPYYVRPLLTCTRQEILAYLTARGVPYVEDSTNAADRCRRNRLRHNVIPLLLEENPRLHTRVAAMTEAARAEEAFLSGLAAEALCRCRVGDGLSCRALNVEPPVLRRRIFLRVLEDLGLKNPSHGFVTALERLAASPDPSASVDLPGGLNAERRYDLLLFTRPEPRAPLAAQPLPVPGTLELPDGAGRIDCFVTKYSEISHNSAYIFYANYDMIVGKLAVRARRQGDLLRLPGGTKSLKRLMIDRKIPAALRARIPVFTVDDRPIAVPGVGMDPAFRPTPGGPTVVIAVTMTEKGEPSLEKQ